MNINLLQMFQYFYQSGQIDRGAYLRATMVQMMEFRNKNDIDSCHRMLLVEDESHDFLILLVKLIYAFDLKEEEDQMACDVMVSIFLELSNHGLLMTRFQYTLLRLRVINALVHAYS